ncbi:hypothetical protein [Facilibium subflavum]|uniref:hypothetical protein n=1 Tax=Facilibium subflavum TaxID=2219058 RepID=UPI000E646C06|nr:hypothetical protein [Facilibium subflavum]
MVKKLILSTFLLGATLSPAFLMAQAPQCTGKDASFLEGKVISNLSFHDGKSRKGVELSHTIFYIEDSKTNQRYQVSIDNVYAKDYDQSHGQRIPESFSKNIKKADHVQLCGELYNGGEYGIHWVHNNCGNNNAGPTGYVIVNGGKSLTSSQEYCNLW